MDVKPKIVYVHPAIRSYRVGIFELLSREVGVEFFWSMTGVNDATHVVDEIRSILQDTKIKYTQGNEISALPFDNFSFKLLALPFKNYDIYVVSNVTSVPCLLLVPIIKLFGKKIIIFDELWRYPHEVSKYKFIYPYVKFLSKHCIDGVVTSGSKAKNFFVKDLGLSPDKVNIAYNTTIDTKEKINDHLFNLSIKEKIRKLTTKKTLLYLGRLVEYKGLDILIRAMEKIDSSYDLIVVGSGPFENFCLRLVQSLNLSNRVHFIGACLSEQAPYYYNNCDIFVLPTRFKFNENVQTESWGFTVNEAMALEVAVITTTAVGSSFDLIIDGVTGGLAEAGCYESLASKVNLVIMRNNDTNVIGKQARKHLLLTCSNESNLISYKKMFKKVLNG